MTGPVDALSALVCVLASPTAYINIIQLLCQPIYLRKSTWHR